MSFYCAHVEKEVIRKAKTRVPRTTAQYRKLLQLTKKFQPMVNVNLWRGITTFKKRIPKEALITAFKKKHFADITREIPWKKLPEDLQPAVNQLHKAAFQAGEFTLTVLPAPVDENLRWDMTNPFLQRYVDRTTANMVSNIEESTTQTIRDLVVRSFNQALTPRQVGNMLHGSIGLFPRWEKAVENYRVGLVKDHPKMSEDRLDSLTDAYRERLLKARAKMIARTETRRATNHGQLSVWQQAHGKGLIKQAKRVWIVDGAPCDICEPMDGETTGLYDSWTLEDGTICDVAGDAHPNCMCTESIELE